MKPDARPIPGPPDSGKWSRRLGVGIIVFMLGGAFLQVAFRETLPDDGIPRIRFAHTLLHGGLREALDAVARDYEALMEARGTPVRVEQLAVPDRTYQQWLRTQLVGGTAPEIVMNQANLSTSMVARYLVPVSDRITEVNPYNEGTPLEGLRWRDTFFDGMEYGGFVFELAEHHGIPVSASTTRIFANRRILDEILADPANARLAERLGPEGIPSSYDAFLELCEAARRLGESTGRVIIPIAGSDTNAALIIDTLVGNQTSRMLVHEQPLFDFRVSNDQLRLDMLTGERLVVDELYRAGLQLAREVGRQMQPGFIQQRREDATFLFTQERAFMIAASVWDAASFRSIMGERFDVVVFPIPTPEPGHPRAPFSYGPPTELGVFPSGVFGLVNIHSHERVERALDFLRYLTSHPGQTTFVRQSGWLPAISEVDPAPGTEAFMPRLEGYPLGPRLHEISPDHRRVFLTRLHLLTAPQDGLERFIESFEPAFLEEIVPSMQSAHRNALTATNQQDTLIGAAWWLATRHPDHAFDGSEKLGLLVDSSHPNEANTLFFQAELQRILRRSRE
ncbi:MAG: carbohydrate ABC transporter substrate-binding protein [Puniceicoccaceae bacterium]|nr:MAG: carbohydrate ABC transporter substrate-binding protein [Puniceicoccaceae bacterium]